MRKQSGSLLGVNYKEVVSYPVGYEEKIQMYPLDLEEFFMANGVQNKTIDYLWDCFTSKKQITDSIHQTLTQLFQYYLIVGGMPAVVSEFVESRDIAKVLQIQKDIIELYRQDISKYSKEDKIRIKDIFDQIPSELSKKNKRFMLSDLNKHARMQRYESSFAWLSDAGVTLPCYNVTEPVAPLKINEKHNLQKLFICDVGLLCAMSLENVQFDILQGRLEVNMGSILENAFAQALKTNGFQLNYFAKKNMGEIDFVCQKGNDIVLIEVKSGNDYKKHAALDKMLKVEQWNLKEAYVFSKGNVEVEENICYLPWYMILFLKQKRLPETMVVNVDLSGLK